MLILRQVFWNAQEHRLRAFWRLLVQIILLVIFSLLSILVAIGLFQSGNISLGPDYAAMTLYSAMMRLLVIVGSIWLAARFLDRRPLADFGLRLNRDWWLGLGFGLSLGALLMTGIFVVELALGWVSITSTFQAANPEQPFALAILVPIVLFMCVGIYEELLTRGYWLHNLAEGLNVTALGPRGAIVLAWLISSALFGALHANNPNASVISTINITLAGVFLGLGYVLTDSLAIPIGLHITWNFFQSNVFGFPVSGLGWRTTFIAIEQSGPAAWTGGNFGPEAGLIGSLAILVGSLLIVLWVRWRHGSIALHTAIALPPVRHVSTATQAERERDQRQQTFPR
jgi:membrane protease YdiL (CAAX protease family)